MYVCVVCSVGWLVGVLLMLAFWGCMYVCMCVCCLYSWLVSWGFVDVVGVLGVYVCMCVLFVQLVG